MPRRPKTDGSTAIIERAGLRLRAIRELAGVKQDDLCQVLGVDQSTYSKWERGRRLPDVLVLIEFAARFRTTLDFLFRGSPGGMHPDLVHLLRIGYPALVADTPTGTEPDKGTVLTSYRAAILLETAH